MPASFDNDVVAIQNALVTLCNAFTDPNGGTVTAARTMSTDGVASSALPYVWVRRGRHLSRDERSSDLYTDSRAYQALVYVQELTDGEFSDEAAFDNATEWIKPFHQYLAQNRQVTEAAEIVVVNVRDSGDVSLHTKAGIRYAGVVFTIPIQYLTRF